MYMYVKYVSLYMYVNIAYKTAVESVIKLVGSRLIDN